MTALSGTQKITCPFDDNGNMSREQTNLTVNRNDDDDEDRMVVEEQVSMINGITSNSIACMLIAFVMCSCKHQNDARKFDSTAWKAGGKERGDCLRKQMLDGAMSEARGCKTQGEVAAILGTPDRVDLVPHGGPGHLRGKAHVTWAYWCGSVTSGSSEYYSELLVFLTRDGDVVEVSLGE